MFWEALRHYILKLPFIFVFIASSCPCYIALKNQLKWLGTKDELLSFVSSQLGIDNSDFQVHDNGTCPVFKAEQNTCNFYTMAQTLQIQGKENAGQLKLDLVALAIEKLTVEVPSANKKQNGGEASHLDSIAANDDLSPVTPEPGPPVIDLLDHQQLNTLMSVISMLK